MLIKSNADHFWTWSPFEPIEKGDEDKTEKGRISGIASSEVVDADDEVVLQKGLDWTYFLSKGFITLEHPLSMSNIVGVPISIEKGAIDGHDCTFLTSDLLLDDPLGAQTFRKAQTLKKSKTGRSLGYSIEGKVLKRKGNTIVKAQVTSVAISPVPKNPTTWFEPEAMAMSMMAALSRNPDLFRAVAAGYPTQGEAAEGDGGFDKTTPQSIQGKPSISSLSHKDMLTAVFLRELPGLSWAQGVAAIDALTGYLG